MERAENLARLLDVNETFAQDSRGPEEWLPILELHSDTERFLESHEEATANAVAHFYVLDRSNPSSIVSAAHMARENARSLRHLISTEMWRHLNVFYERLLALGPRDLHLSRLSELCRSIKEDCQLHTGIVEGTYYRDQGWTFYQIGKWVERSDQTTRLLDMHCQRPSFGSDTAADRLVEASHWNALVRSLAGYHAFRRTYPRGMRSADVVNFLLFDPGFPRALQVCLDQIGIAFDRLANTPDLRDTAPPEATLDAICAAVDGANVESLAAAELHEFHDRIQQQLIRLTNELAEAYFGRTS
jgi:uncharacterized alpha-E superfamily protein